MKSFRHIEYVGNELYIFRHSVKWKDYFSKKMRPYIKGDILEVGAGLGDNTKYLAKNLNLINSWWILEPDKNLAKQIEKNIINIKVKNKRVINGVITDIEKTFDTIIYIDVLEHIQNSEQEIEKIKMRLKINGHLIILVPAYNFLYSDFDKNVGHFRRYNKKILMDEVNGLLRKEKLFYLDSMGFFASLANKLILKKSIPSRENIKFWNNYLITLSKIFDVILLKSFGKSLIGIFKNEDIAKL